MMVVSNILTENLKTIPDIIINKNKNYEFSKN